MMLARARLTGLAPTVILMIGLVYFIFAIRTLRASVLGLNPS